MLTAVKANREEKITEDKKEEYLLAGFDIIDEDGKRTPAPSKTVSYAEYEKLKKELGELKESDDPKLAEENKALKAENKAMKKELEAAKKELEELKKAGA